MSNSAADFINAYCAEDTFPIAVFDPNLWPRDQSIEPSSTDTPFAKVLRPPDVARSGGKFHTSKDFRVVVTSTFKPDNYDRLLKDSLPLDKIQAISICELKRGALGLSGAAAMKGRTQAGDLTEDRTSLLAERRQAEDEERENALSKVK